MAGTALATGPRPTGSVAAPGAFFSAPQPRPPPAPRSAVAAAGGRAAVRRPDHGLSGGGLATSPLFFAPYSSSLVVAADGATTLRLSANAANVVDDAFNPLDGAHVVFSLPGVRYAQQQRWTAQGARASPRVFQLRLGDPAAGAAGAATAARARAAAGAPSRAGVLDSARSRARLRLAPGLSLLQGAGFVAAPFSRAACAPVLRLSAVCAPARAAAPGLPGAPEAAAGSERGTRHRHPRARGANGYESTDAAAANVALCEASLQLPPHHPKARLAPSAERSHATARRALTVRTDPPPPHPPHPPSPHDAVDSRCLRGPRRAAAPRC